MLKIMRDSFHQLKWILLAIVAAFILGFVYFDMGLGGGRTSGTTDRAYAARVNGETISRREYDRALYYTERQYEQMYRQSLTPEMLEAMGLNRQVLDSLVDERLLLQEASRLHLTATPEEVRQRILQIPLLNPDGKFVGPELYTRYVTGQLGFTSAAEFEDELARSITVQKMESAIANGIVVSPKTAEVEYARMNESAKIRYVLYPATKVAANVTVTPAEVEAYYNANKSKYQHGDQREVKYLLADSARIRSQIQPSDAELKKRYDASREDFKTPEAAHILHILIKVDRSATPAEDAAAKAKADSLVAQLRGGADFGKLAKENSGDPSSAGNGGDMGFVDKGTTVAPFDTAAFTIPLNTISDPIRSQEFGYHIIKVLQRRPAGYRTFEEVKGQLAAQVADQMAKDQARDAIARVSASIREKKPTTPEQFAALANDKVSSNDTQWFGKGDQIQGLGSNPALATWAFQAKQGDIGDVIGTQRGPAIPYLYGARPAGVSSLDEIRGKVEADARADKGRQLARQALAAAMTGAPNIDAVGAKAGITVAETNVNRQGYVAGFGPETSALVDAAMKAAPGALTGPVVVGDGAAAFQVIDQNKVDPKTMADKLASFTDSMRQQEARSLRTVLLERLRKQANVDINQSVLSTKAPQEPGA